MLVIESLNFAYGHVQTLYDISMVMRPGSITAIMGRNGVGKTTLIRNIAGLARCQSGNIRIGETELTSLPPHARARKGIGLVPQGRQIFPKLTVEENIQIGLQARKDTIKKVPEEIYEMFPILAQFRSRYGGDLSGGQQQQLAIARALAGDPQVLLLDEPTEGIQPNIIQSIGQILQQLARTKNMTIVLVEQYLDFVKKITHYFYVLNRGRVVAGGETKDLSEEIISLHLKV